MLGELAREGVLAAPVGIRNLGDNLTALFQSVEHRGYIELALQRGFDADLDVIEVDKYGDLKLLIYFLSSVIHFQPLKCLGGHARADEVHNPLKRSAWL